MGLLLLAKVEGEHEKWFEVRLIELARVFAIGESVLTMYLPRMMERRTDAITQF